MSKLPVLGKAISPDQYADTRALLEGVSHVLILPHTMPDGDTVGSSVALAQGLESLDLGIKAYVVLDDVLPKDIAFLGQRIITQAQFESLNITPDLSITVDLSDLERLASRKALIQHGQQPKSLWNIDHHITNLGFGQVQFVDTYASATGEIIFALLKAWGVVLDQTMCEALYVAIATDTGSFKYSSTTPRTHRIVAELIEVGIRRDYLSLHLYHSEPPSKLKLHALSLAQLKIYPKGTVARAYVSLAMLAEAQAGPTESDGLVERIRDIDGIDTVLLLKEVSTLETKISMRSIGQIDLSDLALRHGGGGHRNAAGFTLNMSLDVALAYIDRLILEEWT